MNDKGNMLLKVNFWIQVVVWVALFMMPFTFVRFNQVMETKVYLLLAIQPLAMLILYYLNYFHLLKKYFDNKKRTFWIANVILVSVFSLCVHEGMKKVWGEDHKHNNRQAKEEVAPKHEPPFILFVFLRDAFNFSVVVGVAGAVFMSKRLRDTEQARQKAETAKTQAELSNLRSQINPHFLLNTLNNIYALTAFDTTKAQTAILELSKLLRHILYDNQQPFVSLSEEIVFLHNYIELMKMRVVGNVSITEDINVSDDCRARIAPMIFISLVENAFKHGICPTEQCFIRIRISADNSKIICHIENSDYPKRETDKSGHGVGLQQVARRLELTYPSRYEWLKGRDKNNNVYSSKIIIYDTKLCDN